MTSRGRNPLVLARFHPQGRAREQSPLLKDDLHFFGMNNHFNFLQATHEEDPLLVEGPVGISQVYNDHIKGCAGCSTYWGDVRVNPAPVCD